MTETALQRKIQDYLKKQGFFAWKMHGNKYQMKGMPDILAVRGGTLFAFEVKLPGKENTLTPIQQRRLKQLADHGAPCGMATSIDDVQEIINDYQRL